MRQSGDLSRWLHRLWMFEAEQLLHVLQLHFENTILSLPSVSPPLFIYLFVCLFVFFFLWDIRLRLVVVGKRAFRILFVTSNSVWLYFFFFGRWKMSGGVACKIFFNLIWPDRHNIGTVDRIPCRCYHVVYVSSKLYALYDTGNLVRSN